MKRLALTLAVTTAVSSAALSSVALAAPPARGELMKACMAEWRVKSKATGGEKLKYTAFLSECLKRRNGAAAPKL